MCFSKLVSYLLPPLPKNVYLVIARSISQITAHVIENSITHGMCYRKSITHGMCYRKSGIQISAVITAKYKCSYSLVNITDNGSIRMSTSMFWRSKKTLKSILERSKVCRH